MGKKKLMLTSSRNRKRIKQRSKQMRKRAKRASSNNGIFTAQRSYVPMDSMIYQGQNEEVLTCPDGTIHTTNFSIWHNKTYAVAVYEPSCDGGPTHITVQRFDEKPARDWRHLQQIKNEVCSPEFEAVELFPATSRVVDITNTTHLWVFNKELEFGMYPPDPNAMPFFHRKAIGHRDDKTPSSHANGK